MFSSQIRLLHFPSPTPDPFLRGRSVDDCIIFEHFVFCRHKQASCTDDTERGDADGVVDSGACRYCVEVAYGGAFDATANFEEIIIPYSHDFFPSVHDNSALFDDATHPNHNWTCNGEYSCFGVYDCARAYGDVTLELDILANDGFGVNGELVASE